ncbi:uncharacterized protein LOC116660823 isoform X2 [Camelus ferus]|uniref:Uncharacterized protein LOC116660823 isoform X2 n=1 Tax=Camelus ferus TaxID=419612 RepID=A0A8B8S9X6_CAMFR|nr:uncharacterized protein LOC116660823 isoform X2 [Camelus ferus]
MDGLVRTALPSRAVSTPLFPENSISEPVLGDLTEITLVAQATDREHVPSCSQPQTSTDASYTGKDPGLGGLGRRRFARCWTPGAVPVVPSSPNVHLQVSLLPRGGHREPNLGAASSAAQEAGCPSPVSQDVLLQFILLLGGDILGYWVPDCWHTHPCSQTSFKLG